MDFAPLLNRSFLKSTCWWRALYLCVISPSTTDKTVDNILCEMLTGHIFPIQLNTVTPANYFDKHQLLTSFGEINDNYNGINFPVFHLAVSHHDQIANEKLIVALVRFEFEHTPVR